MKVSAARSKIVSVVITTLISGLLVSIPIPAQAAAASTPDCDAGVGIGGKNSSTVSATKAGNGCVVIKYVASGSTVYESFNFTGANQSWTVPSGVTSVTFYLIGAGGGGAWNRPFDGGGGGFASGIYSVTAGDIYTVIVGEGGGGVAGAAVAGLTGRYSPLTFGGGGRGGSLASASDLYASGGGRSAIRLSTGSSDLVTAAGGGGGSYGQCGAGGGGTSGVALTGNAGGAGTQSAGGTGGASNNSGSIGGKGTAGAAYLGGDSQDEGGGGGGGYFGGGGGGDNGGGGGGSSYIALLASGVTTSGASCGVAATSTGLTYSITYDSNSATSGTVPSASTVTVSGGTLTLPSNSGTLTKTNYTFAGWNTAANGSGTSYAVGATTFLPSGDTTLYAQWNSTITYSGNSNTSGSVPTAQTGIGSKLLTLATNSGTLARTNYTFGGWNTAADGSGTPYAAGLTTYTPTGSTTLYAQWNSTITYSGNGNTGGSVPTSTVFTGSSAGNLGTNSGSLVKTNFYFYGWNTGTDGTGTWYAPGASYVSTGTKTLNAQWVPGCTPSTSYMSGYQVVTFTGVGICYWAQPAGVTSIDTLMVGGGGGGGGQVVSATGVALSGPLFINVGAGGAGGTGIYNSGVNNGRTGSSTSIYDGSTTTIALPGNGGRGRQNSNAGITTGGFTGGGAAYNDAGYTLSATTNTGSGGSGFDGGLAGTNGSGGGGGAGGPGASRANNSSGGIGVASSITGTNTYYGGGGGGTNYNGTAAWTGAGGLGGGGQGANNPSPTVTSGVNGLGGGGGSDWGGSGAGGSGGSGVVIIRYTTAYTVTFDANSGTGSASAATVTQSAPAASLTLSTGGTLARTGYTLTGWNAAADGTGTSYSLGATFTPTSPTTLYANWTGISYTVTYAGNGNTGGSAPANGTYTTGGIRHQIAANSGTLVKTGYTFGGWNTVANASGTIYYPALSGLPTPVQRLEATNYNATNKTWTDSSGAATPLNIPATRVTGTPTILTNTANTFGSTKTFDAVAGTTAAGIKLGNSQLTNYTLCAVARMTGGSNRRLFTSDTFNWLAGWHGGNMNSAYHGGWLVNTGATDTNWHIFCDAGAKFRWDGTQSGTTGGGVTYLPSLTINLGADGETSNWAVADVMMFNSTLTDTQISQVEYYYKDFYGITSVTSSYTGLTTYGTPANITLYAMWNSTITYDANGSTSGTIPAVTTSLGSVSTTLAANSGTLAKTNYTFSGWNTAANGSGTNYAAGATYLPTGNITLYAQWNSVITFSTNFGTPVGAGTPSVSSLSLTGSVNTTLATVGTMVKTGYTFQGWATTSTATTAAYTSGATYVPAGTVTLYAVWTANSYAITFNSNNGSGTMANLAIVAGAAKTLTANGFTRTGYTFASWNTLANGTGTSYAAGASVTLYGDTTLYAQWTAGTFAVGFASTGANGSTLPTLNMPDQTFTAGTPFTLSTNVWYKTGYSFASWNSLANGTGTSYAQNALVTFFGNTTLYPQWTANVYTVTFDPNSGTGAASSTSMNFTYGGTALTLPTVGTLAKTGYSFGGWSTTTTGSAITSPYTPTANIKLYAVWTPGTYAITFNSNGGTGTITNLSVTAGTAKAITSNSFAFTGYGFAGWNTAANGSGTAYANTANITVYGNTTLYAQWSILAPAVPTITAAAGNASATITVTSSQSATVSAGVPVTYTVTAYSGSPAIEVGTPCTVTVPATSCTISSLSNILAYTFKAVATNTTGSSAASTATSSVSPAAYTVTYNVAANGGSVTTTSANTTYNSGTPVTLPTPTNTGYTFSGWYTAASSGTLVGGAGSSYSPTGALTLYAVWSANSYTVTYSGNGSDGGTAVATTSFTFGNSYSIAQATMTKTGYTFAGWTTASNGTGTLYANASDLIASSSATYSSASNLNLYAKWTPRVYTITYDKNGATGDPSKTTDSFTYGTTAITLPAVTGMTYANYTFGGWSESATGSAVISPYSPTQTRTLYALWVGIQYSVSYNANGGTISGTLDDAVYTTGTTGLTLNNGSTLSRTGYTFAGWKTSAGNTVTSPYSATSNITLYAFWTPISPAINFTAGTINGAVPTVTLPSPNPTSAVFGSEFTLPAALSNVTAGDATYVFAGWTFGANTYQAGSKYRMTAAAPTFVAQWLKLLAVRYVLNGGSLATDDQLYDLDCTFEPIDHQCGDKNINITLNKAPTRTGFNFTGWVSQGAPSTLINANTPYTLNDSNYIFYATWSPNTYRITYSAGTGSTSSAAPDQTGNYGDVITLASGGNYSLSGSVFTGWSITTSLGAGALYTLGTDAGTLNVGTGVYDLTATAQYANNTFKIFYNTNGATGGTTPAATVAVSGASIQFDSGTSFSRSGFTFVGWSDGTNVREAGYATTMGSSNSTVFAQWRVALPAVPTFSSVVASNGAVTITIATPTSGGAPSSYTITASSGATCTVVSPTTNCTITGLTNGTSYTFTAEAINATGTSAASSASTAVTPATVPDAPTNVVATAGNTQASVSFTAPATNGSAITLYTVTSSPSGISATGTTSPIIVTGLTNGTTYTFTVTATNAIGNSLTSSSSNTAIPATTPGVPNINTASAPSSTTVSVSISAPSVDGGLSVQSYTVTATPPSPGVAITKTVTASEIGSAITITGLTPGAAYTMSAVATNAVGAGSAGTFSSTVSTPAVEPTAPTIVSAAGSTSTTASISLTAPTNNGGAAITGYVLTLTPSGGGAAVVITTETSATNISATGLAPGTTYTVTSAANNSAGTGASSSSATFTTPLAVSVSVTSVVPNVGSSITPIRTTVTATGATGTTYSISPSLPSDFTLDASTGIITGTATSAVAAALYTITASTTVSGGATATGTAQVTIGVAATVPSAPTSINAAESSSTTASVTVGASSLTGGATITGYTITATPPSPGTPVVQTFTDISSAVTLTGLAPATSYTLSVKANNSVGSSTATEDDSSITTSNSPPVLASVSPSSGVNTGGVAITLTGTGFSAGATVKIAGQSCTSVVVVSSTSITCVTPAATTGVAAITVTNSDAQTSTLTNAFTNSAARPGAPTLSSEAATSSESAFILLSAPDSDGGSPILSYTTTIAPAGGGTPTDVTSAASASSLNLTGLKPGTQYSVTTAAVNVTGAGTSSTAVSFVTPLAITPSVTSLTPAIGLPITPITFAITSTGASGTVYSVSPSLPAGLSINTSTGAVSGTASVTSSAAIYTITATTTVTGGSTCSGSVEVTIGVGELIIVAPSAPTIVNASATSTTEVSIAVIAPTSAGGGTIESYITTLTPSSGGTPITITTTPAASPILVTGLTASTTYSVTIVARNSAGSGTESAAVNVTTNGVTPTPTTPVVDPTPAEPTCNAACQASQAAVAKAAADAAAAAAKSAADNAAAAAAKIKADSTATTASTKAAADAAAAATAAKAAIDKAAAAAVAQVAADAAAKAAAAQAKAASDAQVAAAKAAADAAAALKSATATTAAKAAATASAQKAAVTAAAAVKAAATAAQQAATAKNTAANANKQVDIAINSLNSKTAASQASAQANAIAAAAKTAANEAAAAAATKAAKAKTVATAAQKAAAETAARIATEQKQAADAAALAKIAADAAVKATAEKVSAIAAATKATQDLAKVLADKAVLAEQAAKETDQAARTEIQKKIDEVTTKVEEVQKTVDSANTKADAAVAAQTTAVQAAEVATKEAQTQATEAIDIKTESVVKTAAATKAVAAATVATKVAEAAKAAAAKVPAKATIIPKASTTTTKNSATATVTGLKPGQKVKVTVNVKDK